MFPAWRTAQRQVKLDVMSNAPALSGLPSIAAEGAQVIELRPRCSLTPRTARICVLTVAVPTFTVAGFYTLQGFWPILGFAMLEIVLLGWAMHHSMQAGKRVETITITEDSVQIVRHQSRHRSNDGQISVFPRHWTRVRLHTPLSALHPSRLMFESQGRSCEVGKFLTEDERRVLAGRLKQLVGNVNESPTL